MSVVWDESHWEERAKEALLRLENDLPPGRLLTVDNAPFIIFRFDAGIEEALPGRVGRPLPPEARPDGRRIIAIAR